MFRIMEITEFGMVHIETVGCNRDRAEQRLAEYRAKYPSSRGFEIWDSNASF